MDFELLAILLVALLIGFIIGRWLAPKNSTASDPSDAGNCSESYIQGLNYLLANRPDQAIELFIDLIKVDGETMETHLALGNLFRTRGEVDRAIKIHQNLIARPDLEPTQRAMAIKELAEDYLKAGLLDRAENLYKEMVQINPKDIMAYQKLFELFRLEKAWHEALPCAQKLMDLREPEGRIIVTHSLCEIAAQSLQQGNLKQALEYLNRATRIDEKCIRANLLLIDIQLRNDAVSKAEKILNRLVINSPEFIELYLRPAREIYLQRGSFDRFHHFLMTQYLQKPNIALALELLKSYQSADQQDDLQQFLATALEQSACLEVYEFALNYLSSRPDLMNRLMPQLGEGFKTIKAIRHSFTCQQCGYVSQTMQWHCPTCNSWSTIKPS